MRLNTVEKRLGLVIIILSLILLIFLILAWAFTTPQYITYHMPGGQVFYYKRGVSETALAEMIQLVLIVFPLLAFGLILLLGYGKKLFHWIRFGAKEDQENKD